MRAAATLLSNVRTIDGLETVLQAAGLVDFVHPLDAPGADAIGLGDISARIGGRDGGTSRAIIVAARAGEPLRDAIRRVARTLSQRAPHVLWFAAALDAEARTAAIAGWSGREGREAVRIASFSWEPDNVVDSDAETLCALAAVDEPDDDLRHTRYLEIVGRDALTRKFYRSLRAQVDALAQALPGATEVDARQMALLYASRLLFLSFLEAKGWLNGERAFVQRQFDDCMRRGGGFHARVLLPLFFGTLNTPPSRRARAARALGAIPFLNGGLFTRMPVERRIGASRFPDDRFGSVFEELFSRYRFVAREDSATWSEASIDPEMLGRAFESLMASDERRAGGVYYTPHEIVRRVADEALSDACPTLARARDVRVLDPACGSGAFLVYALERLTTLRRAHGDVEPIAAIRRDVLERSIFGVDLSPTAVWLCELRLWLSVVIESDVTDPACVAPLPNLDRNVRIGDSLAGTPFSSDATLLVGSRGLRRLRQRYVRATGTRKKTLARLLDREERRRVLMQLDRSVEATSHARGELLSSLRTRDLFGERPRTPLDATRMLKRLREDGRRLRVERRRLMDGGALPFAFGACFADVQAMGGFDVVLGNPPWVRLHHIPVHLRTHFRRTFAVYRAAPWAAGAEHAHASAGFASQVDLAALFVERSLALLKHGGVLSLLLPAKLWRALAGGGVRRLLSDAACVVRLEDWSESRHAFDAAVYPSVLIARHEQHRSTVRVAVEHRSARRTWEIPANAMAFDDSPGAPWILLSPHARAAFDRLRTAGVPLGSSTLGTPRLGVKSGCNVAFVVRVRDVAKGIARVEDSDGETGLVEAELLRPALRGEAVAPWRRRACDESIIWTHDAVGAPLARLPAHASAWLRRRYDRLTQRADARRQRRWWSLFRVDAGSPLCPRVVWADFGRRPRALVLSQGDDAVPLNTCYVLPCRDETDARALATLLNSTIAAAWLNALAEPARGGYRRYLGWTVALLPIPRAWDDARVCLADAFGAADDVVRSAVLAAFRLRERDVGALLDA